MLLWTVYDWKWIAAGGGSRAHVQGNELLRDSDLVFLVLPEPRLLTPRLELKAPAWVPNQEPHDYLQSQFRSRTSFAGGEPWHTTPLTIHIRQEDLLVFDVTSRGGNATLIIQTPPNGCNRRVNDLDQVH
jgi:hypothetical protein